MSSNSNPLYNDARRIAGLSNYGSRLDISVKMTVQTDDGPRVYRPIAINAQQITRDFIAGHADVMQMIVLIGIGDYKGLILPSRDNITMQLTAKPLNESRIADPNGPIYTKTYRLIINGEDSSGSTVANTIAQEDERQALNLKGFVEVTFQMFEEYVYQLMQTKLTGIYRNLTPMQCMQSAITKLTQSDQTFAFFSQDAVQYIEIEDSDNAKVYDSIVIPPDTPALDLPNYLQKTYGLYKAGLGSYVYNDTWWIYRLYQYKGLGNKLNTVEFFIVPQSLFLGVENTYEVKGDTVRILIHSGTAYNSNKQAHAVSKESGVRYRNASNLLKSNEVTAGAAKALQTAMKNAKEAAAGAGAYSAAAKIPINAIGTNKINVDRRETLSEFNVIETKDKVNNVKMMPQITSSNPFDHVSQLTRHAGAIISFVWTNASSSLIYPGVNCTINYNDKNEQTQTLSGVVLVAIFQHARSGNVTESVFVCNATITVYIKPQDNTADLSFFTDLALEPGAKESS